MHSESRSMCGPIIFISKTLSKKTPKRAKLRNKFLKDTINKNKKDIRYSEIIVFHFCAKLKKNTMQNMTKKM